MKPEFRDRPEAGERLANLLKDYADRTDVIVLALPRGGVPVAYPIANALHVPLDVCLVRKLGVPGQEELAMGAIASGDVLVLNHEVIDSLHIAETTLHQVAASEQEELHRRDRAYRGDRPFPELEAHTVILVDDGIATGATIQAAIAALRQHQPDRIVVAAPVAPTSVYRALAGVADEVVCLMTPNPLCSIGMWYHDFSQTTDDEVQQLLDRSTQINSTV